MERDTVCGMTSETDLDLDYYRRRNTYCSSKIERARSLYGVSPCCQFGPKGTILDNSSSFLSTGFCPPLPHEKAYDYDFGRDMKHNLALIGSVAHGGIKQVRIHWLLDLVSMTTKKDGSLVYNYDKLDDLLLFLFEQELKPGFELMGSPSGYFNDFENKTQVYLWKDFIKDLGQHFVAEYGLSEVMTWNFETWNEPDCHDFDKVKMTVKGFLNYYDACSEGLKEASPLIKFGGPGAGCDRPGHNQYADGLLQHVVNGQNYFTGEKGVRIDFLSYHRKGDGFSKNILNGEIEIVNEIKKKYPSLANKPFYNDEADPLVGWSKDEDWRADATYAAMVAKVIGQHQNMILANQNSPIPNFTLLSNDNAFLSWFPHQFTQRTLTARFQMNNTNPPHVQFVRKPVHSVMSLLSLHGDQQLKANFTVEDNLSQRVRVQNDSDLGVLVTRHNYDGLGSPDSWQTTVMVYQSMDTKTDPQEISSVELSILLVPPNPNGTTVTVVGYSISNNLTSNPYAMWKNFGSPDFPSVSHFTSMRQAEGPTRFLNASFIDFNNPHTVKFNIRTPEVILLHFCANALQQPDQVTNLAVYNVTAGKVMITWSDSCVNTKCIWTYEVIFQLKYTRVMIRINDYDIISTSFYFTPPEEKDDFVEGTYRVRAVDYSGRTGVMSLPVKYGNF
ncbi:IDUA [Mytilus edulis]|uniref:IDUA n=1 Tax=Mytilus edulis TaxID=6550 RepID=A0A8S3Q1A0_MYTED|nr:IDUA [Mytilus edulis]